MALIDVPATELNERRHPMAAVQLNDAPWKHQLHKSLLRTPTYRVIEQPSNENGQRYIVGVYAKKRLLGTGQDYVKQDAEQHAARDAIERRGGNVGRVLHLIHELGKERGLRSESRVFEAFQTMRAHWPRWLHSIRPATDAEDLRGIDFVFRASDDSELYLQVKSSRRGRDDFHHKYGGRRIGVIVVSAADTDAAIFRSTLQALPTSRSSA